MTDHSELVRHAGTATIGVLVVGTLPGAAVLVLAGVAVAAGTGAAALAPLLGLAARPRTVAARAVAAVLVVLGGPLVAAATLGPRSVPLLACVAGVLVAAWPIVAARSGENGGNGGQAPRNVDR